MALIIASTARSSSRGAPISWLLHVRTLRAPPSVAFASAPCSSCDRVVGWRGSTPHGRPGPPRHRLAGSRAPARLSCAAGDDAASVARRPAALSLSPAAAEDAASARRPNSISFTPSDLVLFMRSPFAAWMERLAREQRRPAALAPSVPEVAAAAKRLLDRVDPPDPFLGALAREGIRAEERALASLRSRRLGPPPSARAARPSASPTTRGSGAPSSARTPSRRARVRPRAPPCARVRRRPSGAR